jgi:hypothetical protein
VKDDARTGRAPGATDGKSFQTDGANPSTVVPDYQPAELVRARLRLAREYRPVKGRERWSFHCPGPNHEHGDRNPSGILTVTDDGHCLLWCAAHCDPRDIASGAGFELRDCFPRRAVDRVSAYRKPDLSPREALMALRHEAFVILVAASDIRQRSEVADEALVRLGIAADRISKACELAGVRV